MSRVEPNRNVYVGHRYVPKIFGEWVKQNEYEGLSIVTHQGNSYTSKKRVPVGIDILNEEFWVVTGNYNAQVEYYRDEVRDLSSDVTNVENELVNKTDKTYVDSELNKKSDITYVDSELNKKSDISYVDNELDHIDSELDKKTDVIKEEVDYYIPDDYDSLQSAIDDIKLKHSNGVRVRITIRAGHTPKMKLILRDTILPNVMILSEDNIIKVSDNLTSSQHLIDMANSYGLIFQCLIDMEGRGSHGIYLHGSSYIRISSNCGVINAGTDGLHVRQGSTALAQYSIFTGASQNSTDGAGISAWGGIVNAHGADVSDSTYYGARAAHGGTLDIDNGKADNCLRHGIRASQNGRVSARYSSAQNAGIHGLYALDASIIHGDQVDVSNATQTGIFASDGSTIQAVQAIANNCSRGAVAERSSTLNVQALTAENCESRALLAAFNSNINARNSELNNCQWHGVECAEGSRINMQNSNVVGSRVRGLDVTGASTVNAAVCNIRNTNPENESAFGVVVTGLSTVNLGTSHVRGNGGTDVVVNNGGVVNLYNCYTTETYGSGVREPSTEDINIAQFNTLYRLGTIYN